VIAERHVFCGEISNSYGFTTAILAVHQSAGAPIRVGLIRDHRWEPTLQQIKNGGRISQPAMLALWREYKQGGDPRVRDRLVFSLAPIVKSIVYRKIREIPVHREVDDLISCGLEAVLRSIERYDPNKGATLEQFAWTRIHGAVLDELRRFDWAPRSLRRLEREMNRASERFTVLHGRAPTKIELADMLAITPKQLATIVNDIARSDVGSLNMLVMSEDDNPSERLETLASADLAADPEHAAMRRRAIARFREVFDELPARERRVAVLLHVNNLTLRETGEILGVSESRVCQIHGKLKRGLRERLQDDAPLFLEVA
jgi:RNA polymerase sigma factor for flagellar operon FliA